MSNLCDDIFEDHDESFLIIVTTNWLEEMYIPEGLIKDSDGEGNLYINQ